MIKLPMSAPSRQRGKGMAALTVVMIIFFVMALVAAYTNRNLVFEQRISSNTYKSARALDAAEAAIDWTLSMLNGGVIDNYCKAPSSPAALAANPTDFTEFRRRYLPTPVDGFPGLYGTPSNSDGTLQMYPACIIDALARLNCICPSPTSLNPTMVTPTDGIGSAFNVLLRVGTAGIVPGVLNIRAQGCANIGTGSTSCYNQNLSAQLISEVDAKTGVHIMVGLVRALPLGAQASGQPDVAALTTGGDVTVTGGTLRVVNGDAGLTVRAGGLISAPGAVYTGVAGAGPALARASDTTLGNLALPSPPGDPWFLSLFGMLPAQYKLQPALIKVPCTSGECTSASLTDTLARYPRHPIWVDGNLTIDNAAALGDMSDSNMPNPIMLVIAGNLTVNAATPITGFLHANNIIWNQPATVRGALMTPGTFNANSTDVTLIYDKNVVNTIRLYYGSFVRVPGSWNSVTEF